MTFSLLWEKKKKRGQIPPPLFLFSVFGHFMRARPSSAFSADFSVSIPFCSAILAWRWGKKVSWSRGRKSLNQEKCKNSVYSFFVSSVSRSEKFVLFTPVGQRPGRGPAEEGFLQPPLFFFFIVGWLCGSGKVFFLLQPTFPSFFF